MAHIAFTTADASKDGSLKDKWFLDSCATQHMTNNKELMFNYMQHDEPTNVGTASMDINMRVVGTGSIMVSQMVNGTEQILELRHVAYVPDIRANLISVTKAQEGGLEILYPPSSTKMIAKYRKEVVMIGNASSYNVCELTNMKSIYSDGKRSMSMFNAGSNPSLRLAHKGMCHINTDVIDKMLTSGAVRGGE